MIGGEVVHHAKNLCPFGLFRLLNWDKPSDGRIVPGDGYFCTAAHLVQELRELCFGFKDANCDRGHKIN